MPSEVCVTEADSSNVKVGTGSSGFSGFSGSSGSSRSSGEDHQRRTRRRTASRGPAGTERGATQCLRV